MPYIGSVTKLWYIRHILASRGLVFYSPAQVTCKSTGQALNLHPLGQPRDETDVGKSPCLAVVSQHHDIFYIYIRANIYALCIVGIASITIL